MSKTNPKVKKGDILVVIKSRNNSSFLENKLVVVTQERQSNFIYVAPVDNPTQTYCLYYSGPADEFILATRENRIEYFKTRNKEIQKELSENNEKIEFLIKYETEEDFVADKLESILTAHSTGKTKASRVKSIKAVLSELKKSDLL
jgi:hypothetical protein